MVGYSQGCGEATQLWRTWQQCSLELCCENEGSFNHGLLQTKSPHLRRHKLDRLSKPQQLVAEARVPFKACATICFGS